MQDLSALTPPLLVCAVVIIAIVAFLRHEMSRSRTARSPSGKNKSVLARQRDDAPPHQADDDSDASRTSSGDS